MAECTSGRLGRGAARPREGCKKRSLRPPQGPGPKQGADDPHGAVEVESGNLWLGRVACAGWWELRVRFPLEMGRAGTSGGQHRFIMPAPIQLRGCTEEAAGSGVQRGPGQRQE